MARAFQRGDEVYIKAVVGDIDAGDNTVYINNLGWVQEDIVLPVDEKDADTVKFDMNGYTVTVRKD